MKPGDRVTTPGGPAQVIRFWADRRLVANQPVHLAWVTVRLDSGGERNYPPAACKP